MPTYKIDMSMDIRAYGYVEVEADSLKGATMKLDHDYLYGNFTTHGSGADDFDYSPFNVSLLKAAWYTDDTEDEKREIAKQHLVAKQIKNHGLELDVPNPWYCLDRLTKPQVSIILTGLKMIQLSEPTDETALLIIDLQEQIERIG